MKDVVSAMGTLEPYQRFRARAQALDPGLLAVFSTLRPSDAALRAVPVDQLEAQVRNIIRREALLSWKARVETARPALLVEQEELQQKIKTLADLDRQFRAVNRELLAADIDTSRFGTQTAWTYAYTTNRPPDETLARDNRTGRRSRPDEPTARLAS